MGVTSYQTTQYTVKCDNCGIEDTAPDSWSENVHSKQQAIKWADMHKVKDGRVLCDKCYVEYKNKQ